MQFFIAVNEGETLDNKKISYCENKKCKIMICEFEKKRLGTFFE